jgi:hypothetical protein
MGMNADTAAALGLPAEFPAHLRWAEQRIRAALGALDPTVWHFAIKKNLLIGARRWPHVGVDTLAVIGPDLVIGRRDELAAGHVWDALDTVEEIVRAITALGAPGPGGRVSPP